MKPIWNHCFWNWVHVFEAPRTVTPTLPYSCGLTLICGAELPLIMYWEKISILQLKTEGRKQMVNETEVKTVASSWQRLRWCWQPHNISSTQPFLLLVLWSVGLLGTSAARLRFSEGHFPNALHSLHPPFPRAVPYTLTFFSCSSFIPQPSSPLIQDDKVFLVSQLLAVISPACFYQLIPTSYFLSRFLLCFQEIWQLN